MSRLDLRRNRASIAESVTPVQGQGLVWGTPKTNERRDVPIPRFLAAEPADYVRGKQPGDLVFPGIRTGQPLRVSTFRAAFSTAAKVIGVSDLHPHQLRHTAASLAIASGAEVKVVQQMLGHSSATMTLDTYGHLFDDRLDEVSDAMDRARNAARGRRTSASTVARAEPAVAPVLPHRNSADLQPWSPPSVSAGQSPFRHCTPDRIRTGATAVKGRGPGPLDDGGPPRRTRPPQPGQHSGEAPPGT